MAGMLMLAIFLSSFSMAAGRNTIMYSSPACELRLTTCVKRGGRES